MATQVPAIGQDVTALMGSAPDGQPLEAGNIDLYAQPTVTNQDGTTSTVHSRSYNIDGKEVLLPSVTPDGRHLSTDDDVIAEFKKTGRHLGKFNTPAEATAFAEQLHNDYAAGKYAKQSTTPAVGDDVTHLMSSEPTFKGENEKDAQGNAVVRGASAAWNTLNEPLLPEIADAAHAIAAHIDAPALDRSETMAQIRGFFAGATDAGGKMVAGFTSPVGIALTLAGLKEEGILAEQIPALKSLLKLPAVAKLQRAVQGAGGAMFATHGADRVIEAPTMGEKAQGVAEMAAGGLGVTSALRTGTAAGASSVAASSKLTAPEQASNAFAEAHGVPLDAATATGSRTARAAQKIAANSMGGEGTAERLIQSQQQALRKTGAELADQVHPDPVFPEGAGAAIQESTKDTIRSLDDVATAAYDKLRKIEADPKYAERHQTAPNGSSQARTIMGKMAAGMEDGRTPTSTELKEVRRIAAELDALPYKPGKLVDAVDGQGHETEHYYDPRSAGAPVYHDILQLAPGTADMTRADVLRNINRMLETGHMTDAGRGAILVARARLAGNQGVSAPYLPPGAGDTIHLVGKLEDVPLPVNIAPAQKALRPVYDRLMRESELVPLQGEKARALTALDRLMTGPRVAPVSVVDGALSDLKAMARGAMMPELRSQGQGLAAHAVKQLDAAVRAAVAKAGPEAEQALEQGRSATMTKHAVAEVLDAIKDEPVGAFRQATQAKDAGIGHLRQLQNVAPDAIPKVGRALLEEMLGRAGERERFDHADKLYADWQRLGPETKRTLFPQSGQVQALDSFFLLAKRIAENPNPSGTAHVLTAMNFGSQPLMYGLAKLLYTPRGVRALNRVMSGSLALPKPTPATIRSAARTAGWAELVAASKSAGVPLALPQAASVAPEAETQK